MLSGRVRVPWKTITASPTSLFADITGVETFEDGDKTSHVVIKLPQIPHDTERDQFKIALDQPKSSDARLGDISSCVVNVHNDIGKIVLFCLIFFCMARNIRHEDQSCRIQRLNYSKYSYPAC